MLEQLASAGASLRAEPDDPVGGGDDVGVVLDDDHGDAAVSGRAEHVQETIEVSGVESGGRLVDDEEIALAGRRELARELHALGLAAREPRRRLPECEVVEAERGERGQDPRRAEILAQELARLADAQAEDVGDVERASVQREAHGERLRAEPAAPAGLARQPGRQKEAVTELDGAHPLACRAGALGSVEGEGRRRQAARASEEVADARCEPRVRRRVRPRVSPDRGLVDDHGPQSRTGDRGAADRVAALERGDEHVANERRLPRAGGAGDDGEAPDREVAVEAAQVP